MSLALRVFRQEPDGARSAELIEASGHAFVASIRASWGQKLAAANALLDQAGRVLDEAEATDDHILFGHAEPPGNDLDLVGPQSPSSSDDDSRCPPRVAKMTWWINHVGMFEHAFQKRKQARQGIERPACDISQIYQ